MIRNIKSDPRRNLHLAGRREAQKQIREVCTRRRGRRGGVRIPRGKGVVEGEESVTVTDVGKVHADRPEHIARLQGLLSQTLRHAGNEATRVVHRGARVVRADLCPNLRQRQPRKGLLLQSADVSAWQTKLRLVIVRCKIQRVVWKTVEPESESGN